MIKEAIKKGTRKVLESQPHAVRFLDASREPYQVGTARQAVNSAEWLNRSGYPCVVQGPAFEHLETLRELWGKFAPEDAELRELIFPLVAYGNEEKYRDTVLRSPYLAQQIAALPELLRAELENFIKPPR